MCRGVEPLLQIGGDVLEILRIRFEEVNDGNIGNGVS